MYVNEDHRHSEKRSVKKHLSLFSFLHTRITLQYSLNISIWALPRIDMSNEKDANVFFREFRSSPSEMAGEVHLLPINSAVGSTADLMGGASCVAHQAIFSKHPFLFFKKTRSSPEFSRCPSLSSAFKNFPKVVDFGSRKNMFAWLSNALERTTY